MKIWITRDTAGSVYSGGLERLWVWFREPTYHFEVLKEKDRDTPFGFIHESHGALRMVGWDSNYKFGIHNLSFGNWLGYGDEENENKEIAQFVWNKLIEHFNNEPMSYKWVEMEREGIVKQQDFLIELEIKIELK